MKIDALILAGGKSSRMGGRHKGSLLYNGRPLTERMALELGSLAENVFISYGETVQQDTSFGIPVQDIIPGCGPMSGLHAGLQESRADLVLTAPCDMPLLTADFYRYLLSRMPDPQTDAVVACRGSRMEPLAAVYRPSCWTAFDHQLRTGQYRIRAALQGLRVVFADVSGNEALSAMLVNVNHPEDYARLAQREAEEKRGQP